MAIHFHKPHTTDRQIREARELVERFRAMGRATAGHGVLCHCADCRTLMELGDCISRFPFPVLEAVIGNEQPKEMAA